MPHRDLPADFEHRYRSSWVDVPWWELGDPQQVQRYYNWSLDELLLGARLGFDGVGTNEHHQNVYGFWTNPNLAGAILAKITQDENLPTAIVQLGATITSTTPPVRIAEEYAVIDCISGGRLVAGFPVGLSADANISYGIPPIESRERWREALDLILKAWTARDYFTWNGKYFKLPRVNLWPRPVQDPHPPILIPGAASSSTWDFVHDRDYSYAFLSYFGGQSAINVADRFWERAVAKGRDLNPYRLAYLQLVGVAPTDEEAEKLFAPHVEYFYHKLLHLPTFYTSAPGHTDYRSLVFLFTGGTHKYLDLAKDLKALKAIDMYREGFVVVGSPNTVRQRLISEVQRLRAGHLMVVLQFGSMPHELAKENIELFSREVLPALRSLWDNEGWEPRWWPKAAHVPAGASA